LRRLVGLAAPTPDRGARPAAITRQTVPFFALHNYLYFCHKSHQPGRSRGPQSEMSQDFTMRRVTAPDIRNRKGGDAPIVALTAYHAHTARIIDPYVDMLLVGDPLGMVMHGYETTVPVPLDLMIMHAQAVVRGSTRALVVVDMPFRSYEESPPVPFRNAARVIKETGCGPIKTEGGQQMAETIRYLSERGVPVMSHIGMTPQAINTIGSFSPPGRRRPEGRPGALPRQAPWPSFAKRWRSFSPRPSPS